MPWVKIDDHFDEHPKFAKVGPLGVAMWVTGLAYCNRNLTDGFIPWSVARNLVSWEFPGPIEEDGRHKIWEVGMSCGMRGEDVTCKAIIPLLVDAGLWDEVEGGYQVHDYPEYQPTKEQVLAERKANADRQSRFRERKGNGVTNAVTNEAITDEKRSRNEPPVPVPVPDTPLGDKSPKPPRARKEPQRVDYSPEFDSFWQVYPSGHGVKKATYEHWKRLAPDTAMVQAMIDGVTGWLQSDRWRRGYVMDAERFLKERAWESIPPPQSAASLTVHRGGNSRASPGRRGFTGDELLAMSRAPNNDPDDSIFGDVIEAKGRIAR